MKRIVICLILLLLLVSQSCADDVHVYGNESIQHAISWADEEDTIYVHPGTYIENIIVDKSVTIEGDDAATTMVKAAHPSRQCFLIRSNDVHLSGFGIIGSTTKSSGIHLSSSHNSTITNNMIMGNYAGVFVEYTNNSTISDNLIMAGGWAGIAAYNRCNDLLISGNMVTHSDGCGISLKYYVNNTTIMGNTVENIDGKGAIYSYTNCYNTTITGNTVKNNMCTHGAIFVSIGDNHTITDNIVTDNVMEFYGGITLYSTSNGNIVTRNILTNNTRDDLHVRFAQDCLIYDNYINKTAHICFTTHDPGKLNSWNITPTLGTNIIGGNLLGGNFWGNYTGRDNNSDGIGDVPFKMFRIFDSEDHDFHPLVELNARVDCGDVDCNDYISANDAVEAFRKAVAPEHPVVSEWAADVDDSGYISANDAVEIFRKAVNPEHQLSCGTTGGTG